MSYSTQNPHNVRFAPAEELLKLELENSNRAAHEHFTSLAAGREHRYVQDADGSVWLEIRELDRRTPPTIEQIQQAAMRGEIAKPNVTGGEWNRTRVDTPRTREMDRAGHNPWYADLIDK
jgi:hypothetical protein